VPLVEKEQLTLPEHLGLPLVFSEVRVTRSLVYVYCRPTWFPCQMVFVSFISNTTGVTSWAWTDNPYRSNCVKPWFEVVFVLRGL